MSQLFSSGGQSTGASASASVLPVSEYSGLISFKIDWFGFIAVQGSLKSLLRHHNLKASPPGSPVPGILQARTLEWVAISFSSSYKLTLIDSGPGYLGLNSPKDQSNCYRVSFLRVKNLLESGPISLTGGGVMWHKHGCPGQPCGWLVKTVSARKLNG